MRPCHLDRWALFAGIAATLTDSARGAWRWRVRCARSCPRRPGRTRPRRPSQCGRSYPGRHRKGRTVVEWRQGCHSGVFGEGHCLVERAVAPADPTRPLVQGCTARHTLVGGRGHSPVEHASRGSRSSETASSRWQARHSTAPMLPHCGHVTRPWLPSRVAPAHTIRRDR